MVRRLVFELSLCTAAGGHKDHGALTNRRQHLLKHAEPDSEREDDFKGQMRPMPNLAARGESFRLSDPHLTVRDEPPALPSQEGPRDTDSRPRGWLERLTAWSRAPPLSSPASPPPHQWLLSRGGA
jgi:hypothetical protein